MKKIFASLVVLVLVLFWSSCDSGLSDLTQPWDYSPGSGEILSSVSASLSAKTNYAVGEHTTVTVSVIPPADLESYKISVVAPGWNLSNSLSEIYNDSCNDVAIRFYPTDEAGVAVAGVIEDIRINILDSSNSEVEDLYLPISCNLVWE